MIKLDRLLILGHPHSGSSLLKSILGQSPNAHEIVTEQPLIYDSDVQPNKITIAKWPMFGPQYDLWATRDHQKVILIRDPAMATKSLSERFSGSGIPNDHKPYFCLYYWRWYMDFWLNYPGIKLRYRDIFDKNFLERLMKDVGLEVPEDPFGDYERRISNIDIPKDRPSQTDHVAYRQWQINQRIVNRDTCDKNLILTTLGKEIQKLPEYKKIFSS